MKICSWCLRMAAMLLALGLAVMPAAAETVLADYQDTYEYSYTWRVTDGWAPGWADVRMEAEVLYDQSTGEWHLARTDIRAVRGFCTSSKTIEEIPMSAYLITGGENPRLELKCDTVLEYEYGPFSRYQDLKQEYTFQLDEPGDVLAPGVPAKGTMDLRTYLSLALGFLMWPPVVLLIAYLLWRRFKKRLDAIQPMETPGSDREVKQE